MNAIKNNAAKAVRSFLSKTYQRFEGKPLIATDHMDDGTPISVSKRSLCICYANS